jgi:hypothetical protein
MCGVLTLHGHEVDPFNIQLFASADHTSHFTPPGVTVMSFYHQTPSVNVPSIMRHGFLPATPLLSGVFVRRVPKPPEPGHSLLEIQVDPRTIKKYGHGGGDFLIPVPTLHRGRIRVIAIRQSLIKTIYHPQLKVHVAKGHSNELRGDVQGFPRPHVYNTDCPGETCDSEPLHTWGRLPELTAMSCHPPAPATE